MELVDVDDSDVPLTLGELETSIRFVESPHLDLKTIIEVFQE
jgi:hypothetical protein